MKLFFSVTTAWLATIGVFLLSIIYILRIYGKKNKESFICKINRKFRKVHIPVFYITLLASIVHAYLSVLPMLSINPGTISILIMILMGLITIFRKKICKFWVYSHRILSLIVCCLVIFHIYKMGLIGFERYFSVFEREDVSGNHASVDSVTDDEDFLDQSTEDSSSSSGQEDNSENSNNSDSNQNDTSSDNDGENSSSDMECADDCSDSLTFVDGEYTGVANGFGDDLTVKVVVENGQIASIEIIDHNEQNERIYGKAFETVPGEIIESQSTCVDAVSGATYSSYGIMMAVENALKDAVATGSLPEIILPRGVKLD